MKEEPRTLPPVACTALLGGLIKLGKCMDYRYDTVKLVQPDGYEIDLLLRFIEWAGCHNGNVSVRYWISNGRTSFQKAQDGFVKRLCGALDADCEANEYSYSEWTSGIDYDTELKVGGHDLLAELQAQQGKWLWIEISPNPTGQPRTASVRSVAPGCSHS